MPDAPHQDDAPTIVTPVASTISGSGGRASRPPALSPGELLAGRFRIVRFIARGGMGEVYEAEDLVLRDHVALKTIRADIAGDALTMERFLREVHLARKVTHPNVSRIFDVFRDGEAQFLTMELLEGETLAQRIARTGPLTPQESLPLVAQMAGALSAAHEAGVVHRDFKSANVMLAPDTARSGGIRAVVTDFGLARRHGPGSASALTLPGPRTETEAVVGTPDYMAPEQVEGGKITPAVDLYALGIVLYEMVTGDRPFTGESPITVAIKRLRELPQPPRARVPDLDPRWNSAILRCLERDPADRFASASDLARALGGEPVAPGTGAQRRRRRRRIAIGVAAAVLLAGVAAFLVSRAGRGAGQSQAPTATRAPRRSIAVLGFKNLAGRPEAAWLSTALSELLTTELAAGEKLRAVASEDVARMRVDLALPETDALGRESLARVRRNLGADLVLLGSYLASGPSAGGAVRLDLRLQDAAAGETIAIVSEKGTERDLDALVTGAGERLREKLGVGAVSEAEAAAVRAALPSNTDAQRLYAEGLAKLRVFEALEARDLLQRAVAADPGHALAYSALAAAWSDLGYDAKALAQAKEAFDRSGSLSRETRLLVEGRYREMENDWARSIEIYRSLFTFFPDNLEYGLHLARVQTSGGRPNDALATIAQLRRSFGSEDPRIDLGESVTAKDLSDYRKMEAAATRAVTLGESRGERLLVGTARLNQAIAWRNLGDPRKALAPSQEARRLFAEAGDRGAAASASNSIGNSHYDLGDLDQARKAFEEVLAVSREIGNDRMAAGALDNIASVVGDQGDLATARRLSEESLTLYRRVGDRIGEARVLNNLAAGFVISGDFREARTLFERTLPIHRETGDEGSLAITLNNLAEMLAEQGDVSGAKARYEESFKIFDDSGQKTKAVYPSAGLAEILLETGDLGGARKRLEEGLAVCREGGDRHEEAYILSGLASLAVEEDRLRDAQRGFREAFRIREEIGEKGAAEQSRLDLARVTLEEGKTAEAGEAARMVAEELARQKLPDDEAVALALLGRARLAEGRLADARRVVESARKLAAKSQRDHVRREVQLVSALLRAGDGDPGGARRTLEAAIAHAKTKGLLVAEFEARLALGRVEVESGRKPEGRSLLQALEQDAAGKGFRRIARKAAAVSGSRAGG
jgi:tetratricopeptide (TPR) repeat protein/tRNA A-37 threonylcarbamoyl transferase component Bud32